MHVVEYHANLIETNEWNQFDVILCAMKLLEFYFSQ